MTDDKIIEAVAQKIYESRVEESVDKSFWPKWDHLSKVFPAEANEYRRNARAGVDAYKKALAEDGFVIHRFHDWVYPDSLRDPSQLCPLPHCRRCGVQMGGILDAASCVPGEATSPPPAEP